MHTFFKAIFWLGSVGVLSAAAPVDPTADAQKVLTDHGLAKVGLFYLLQVDQHLADRLRTIRAGQAQLANYARQRQAIQNDVTHATAVLDDLAKQSADIDEQEKRNGKEAYASYNELVNQHNAIAKQIHEGEAFLQRRTEDLSKLVSPSSPAGEYVTLSDDMEAAQARYSALAADADVKKSLDQINAAGPHVHLGPSGLFTQQFPVIRHQHDLEMKAAIKGTLDNGTLQIVTLLNQTTSVPMIVDSGCSTLLLTTSIAKQAGVEIKANGRVVTATIANGSHVQEKVGTIATLKVGQFTLKNVECEVLPPGVEAECLLGGSFLQHFLYQVDLNAAELRLTPLSTGVSADAPAAPGAATLPVSPSPIAATSQPTSAPTGSFDVTIHAVVDSHEEFVISSQGVKLNHLAGKLPTKVEVNDTSWNVKAALDIPADGALEALHHVDFASAHATKQSGRGTITVTADDSGTHLVIVDGRAGAGEYSVTLSFALKS